MAKKITPFSAAQLIPKEETLEIQKTSSELFIGIPKEVYFQEKRICLTPDAVSGLTVMGHRILIESGAGMGAGYTDKHDSDARAEMTTDTNTVFSCPIVLKVEPPPLEETEMMQSSTVLISAIQFKARQKNYFQALAKKKITALAFEYL